LGGLSFLLQPSGRRQALAGDAVAVRVEAVRVLLGATLGDEERLRLGLRLEVAAVFVRFERIVKWLGR
jgi:hypothetical protein